MQGNVLNEANALNESGHLMQQIIQLDVPNALGGARMNRVFVAYPYRLGNEYRRPFRELENLFDVKFVFADETITSRHIIDKIQGLIKSSVFGIYDITWWNANVTLELGLAMGVGAKVYIAFNAAPEHGSQGNFSRDVPSDIRGIDRLQYGSFGELRRLLQPVLQEHFPFHGHRFQAPDFAWSPSGQPAPTDMVHAAFFRDIEVLVVQNPQRHGRMTVDVSVTIDKLSWPYSCRNAFTGFDCAVLHDCNARVI